MDKRHMRYEEKKGRDASDYNKRHSETTLLLYPVLSSTELCAKLVAEEPCCAASEQRVVEDYKD